MNHRQRRVVKKHNLTELQVRLLEKRAARNKATLNEEAKKIAPLREELQQLTKEAERRQDRRRRGTK